MSIDSKTSSTLLFRKTSHPKKKKNKYALYTHKYTPPMNISGLSNKAKINAQHVET